MEKIEGIGRKLSIFNFGKLQDLVTLFDILEREELSLEDVKEFIASSLENYRVTQARFQQMSEEREKLWKKNTRKCPTCMMPLMARPITIPKGKGNREGYTCHWFCQEEKCNFEEYTHEDFKEVYQKIMGRR